MKESLGPVEATQLYQTKKRARQREPTPDYHDETFPFSSFDRAGLRPRKKLVNFPFKYFRVMEE